LQAAYHAPKNRKSLLIREANQLADTLIQRAKRQVIEPGTHDQRTINYLAEIKLLTNTSEEI
jgi:hypothetical protein